MYVIGIKEGLNYMMSCYFEEDNEEMNKQTAEDMYVILNHIET